MRSALARGAREALARVPARWPRVVIAHGLDLRHVAFGLLNAILRSAGFDADAGHPGRADAMRRPVTAMPYYVVLVIHLLCAFVFVGTVFFEVLVLHAVRRHVSAEAFAEVERGIGRRVRRVMPWVLLLLYAAGIALAWHYRAVFAHPFATPFATMLTLKVVLATSVFLHFLHAMRLRRTRRLTGARSRRLHLSVFAHVVAIVLLAKGLFHVSW